MSDEMLIVKSDGLVVMTMTMCSYQREAFGHCKTAQESVSAYLNSTCRFSGSTIMVTHGGVEFEHIQLPIPEEPEE